MCFALPRRGHLYRCGWAVTATSSRSALSGESLALAQFAFGKHAERLPHWPCESESFGLDGLRERLHRSAFAMRTNCHFAVSYTHLTLPTKA